MLEIMAARKNGRFNPNAFNLLSKKSKINSRKNISSAILATKTTISHLPNSPETLWLILGIPMVDMNGEIKLSRIKPPATDAPIIASVIKFESIPVVAIISPSKAKSQFQHSEEKSL